MVKYSVERVHYTVSLFGEKTMAIKKANQDYCKAKWVKSWCNSDAAASATVSSHDCCWHPCRGHDIGCGLVKNKKRVLSLTDSCMIEEFVKRIRRRRRRIESKIELKVRESKSNRWKIKRKKMSWCWCCIKTFQKKRVLMLYKNGAVILALVVGHWVSYSGSVDEL